MVVRTEYTYDEWCREARRRFGRDSRHWKFICPSCGHIASVQEWKDAGADEGAVAFSCIGRWLLGPTKCRDAFQHDGGPCNYAGGGLIRINPVKVLYKGEVLQVFDFAPKERP